MAVSDYKTTPDQNTTISGINIAEGCPPSGINNAIRQLMADIKAEKDTKDGNVTSLQASVADLDSRVGTLRTDVNFMSLHKEDKNTCLPLAGGTISGDLTVSGSITGTLNGKADTADWADKANSATSAVTATNSTNATNAVYATYDSNGRTIESVVTNGNGYIRLGSGVQICWGTAQHNTVTYFGAAFIRSPSVACTTVGAGNVAKSTITAINESSFTYYTDIAYSGLYVAVGRWV